MGELRIHGYHWNARDQLNTGGKIGISRYHHEDYTSWWVCGEEGATQGTGVGMLVSKWWNNHSGKRTSYGSRAMAQEFNFRRGLKLIVINCYIPSSDPNGEEADKILKWVQATYDQAVREKERSYYWATSMV